MKKSKLFSALCLLFLSSALIGQSIERSVVSSGGESRKSGGIEISSTIGESIVATSKNATLTITQGFQQGTKKKDVIDPVDTTSNVVERSKNRITLFPNPTHSEVRIKAKSDEDFNVIVVDGLGKQLYEASVQLTDGREHHINVAHWATGTYYFKLVSQMNNTVYDYVVMKE